jgi:hypothetical protein
VFALDLGAQAGGGAQGKALDGLDQKLAALLGTSASEIRLPIWRCTRARSRHTYR